jgi:hypothetical protein
MTLRAASISESQRQNDRDVLQAIGHGSAV